MAKRAVRVLVQTFVAECPCGGTVIDAITNSYELNAESINHLMCDTCESNITLGVTARIN